MTRPNIIMIITDQQRWDTIGAHGYGHMVTPTLDRLCEGGVSFTQAFAPGATCISSRAAIFTGMYPHNTGVYSFNAWGHHNTWVSDLADGGYHCVNIGKMHTAPMYGDNGFHERFVVENKCENFAALGLEEDEWGQHLLKNGLKRPLNRADDYDDWRTRLNAVAWEHDEKHHSDAFVGDTAIDWLDRWKQEKPLFLEVGFPGPHEPYDPPQRFIDLYADADIPLPAVGENELAGKPPQHKAHQELFQNTEGNGVIDYTCASEDEIRKVRRHYYANISLIDERIGQLLATLDRKGMLDNSVVIFTSDHGDSLGDHGLAYKWLMYDAMVRVPLIIKDFRAPRTASQDHVVSLMDLAPTILTAAGVPLPAYLEGQALQPCLREDNTDALPAYVFCEDNYIVMARSQNRKLVYYIDQPYGELYDLEADPDELTNLWDDPDWQGVKSEIKGALLDWLARSNYLNSNYKQSRSRTDVPLWPERDGHVLHKAAARKTK
jgi:arylsulfatase